MATVDTSPFTALFLLFTVAYLVALLYVVVLERSRVGATWRQRRWDSFRLVTPNAMLRLPGAEYAGPDPEGFLDRDGVVEYLDAYARRHQAHLARLQLRSC